MNLRQKVAFNTGIQVAGQVVGLAVALLTLKLTTDYLGVETFGKLAIVLAVSGILTTLADLGVNTTLARELAKTPERADELGGHFLRFRVWSAIVLVAAGTALVAFLPYDVDTRVALLIALGSVLFGSLATFPRAFFQTHLRLHLQAAVDVLLRVLGLGAILIVIAFGLGLHALVALLVAANFSAAAAAFLLSRRFWRVNLRSEWSRARPLIRDSLGIGVVSMIGLLHLKADAVLLSFLKPAADVGIYTVAFRFVEQAFFLPGLFVAAVFPILARYVHTKDERLQLAVNRTFQVLLLGAVSVILGLFILAPEIVRLITTSEFDAAITPARILSVSLAFVFVGPVFYNLLFAINRQRELIVIGVLALLLNLSLNLVLIPPYSYNGAAVATVVSECVGFIATYAVARRFASFRLDLAFLARAAAATGTAVLAAAATWGQSPWLVAVVAEVAFVATAYAVGAVSRVELQYVLRRQGG